MFERTNDRDEDHVDERAYPWFSYMYGGNPAKHYYGWNSTKNGIRPTSTFDYDGTEICAYCGRRALPIQSLRGSSLTGEYFTKGHCCVCKDAMDELECRDKEEEVRQKMRSLISDIRRVAPRPKTAVAIAIVKAKAEYQEKQLTERAERGSIDAWDLKQVGLKINQPNGDFEND